MLSFDTSLPPPMMKSPANSSRSNNNSTSAATAAANNSSNGDSSNHYDMPDHTEFPLARAGSISPRRIPHSGMASYSSVEAMMESAPSLTTPFSDDMEMILSPSTGTEDLQRFLNQTSTETGSSFRSGSSTVSVDDSIIQRVEQEIEAARLEVASSSRHDAKRKPSDHDDDADMQDILNILSSRSTRDSVESARDVYSPPVWDSDAPLAAAAAGSSSKDPASAALFDRRYAQYQNDMNLPRVESLPENDSSFDHVLHLIDNEFINCAAEEVEEQDGAVGSTVSFGNEEEEQQERQLSEINQELLQQDNGGAPPDLFQDDDGSPEDPTQVSFVVASTKSVQEIEDVSLNKSASVNDPSSQDVTKAESKANGISPSSNATYNKSVSDPGDPLDEVPSDLSTFKSADEPPDEGGTSEDVAQNPTKSKSFNSVESRGKADTPKSEVEDYHDLRGSQSLSKSEVLSAPTDSSQNQPKSKSISDQREKKPLTVLSDIVSNSGSDADKSLEISPARSGGFFGFNLFLGTSPKKVAAHQKQQQKQKVEDKVERISPIEEKKSMDEKKATEEEGDPKRRKPSSPVRLLEETDVIEVSVIESYQSPEYAASSAEDTEMAALLSTSWEAVPTADAVEVTAVSTTENVKEEKVENSADPVQETDSQVPKVETETTRLEPTKDGQESGTSPELHMDTTTETRHHVKKVSISPEVPDDELENDASPPQVPNVSNDSLPGVQAAKPLEISTEEDAGQWEEDENSLDEQGVPQVMDWSSLADNTSQTISYRVPREAESTLSVDSPEKAQQSAAFRKNLTARAEAKKLINRNRHGLPSPRKPEKKSDENLISKINQSSIVVLDDDVTLPNRNIRIRNPFPVLKPAPGPRDDESISLAHSVGVPNVHVRWLKPRPELKTLIVAAMGTSLQRRSNACGALKVLTTKKKNQLMLVRTDSFLSAIFFTASQDIVASERDLALDARERAISCLRNVCSAKENRVNIIQHPGVVECLLKVVIEDKSEARATACAALAMLAKSPECREALIQFEEILDALAFVLRGDEVTNTSYVDALLSTVDERKTPVHVESSVTEFSHMSGSDSSGIEDDDDNSRRSAASPQYVKKRVESANIEQVESLRNRREEKLGEFQQTAQLHACAFLVHMSRHCAVSHNLATNDDVLDSCVKVASDPTNPLHVKCIEILRNLTLFPGNNFILTRHYGVVDTFINAANSVLAENRISALRALQNMTCDSSSKALLASRPVLDLLTMCAMRRDAGEKEAAVAALYNITTEPSAVVAITNTANVVATLVHLAHSPDSAPDIRLLACEALATTSLWLQTLAATGIVPEGVPNVPLPSHKTYGWDRWE